MRYFPHSLTRFPRTRVRRQRSVRQHPYLPGRRRRRDGNGCSARRRPERCGVPWRENRSRGESGDCPASRPRSGRTEHHVEREPRGRRPIQDRTELEDLYADYDITGDSEVITYCRIGERSSITWFTLHELLGYGDVRNYDGSWTECGNLIRSPIEVETDDPATRATEGQFRSRSRRR